MLTVGTGLTEHNALVKMVQSIVDADGPEQFLVELKDGNSSMVLKMQGRALLNLMDNNSVDVTFTIQGVR